MFGDWGWALRLGFGIGVGFSMERPAAVMMRIVRVTAGKDMIRSGLGLVPHCN